MTGERLSTPLQIRYSDMDSDGHVNNALYSTYFELGRVSLLQLLLGKDHFRYSFVLARTEINYLRRLEFGDSPICETWIDRIGNTSMSFRGRIMLGDEEVSNNASIVVHVGHGGKPAKISDEMIHLLEPYVGRKE